MATSLVGTILIYLGEEGMESDKALLMVLGDVPY